MVKLGINIDHIASIRNLRLGTYPSPVAAARIVETSGGDSITVHLREDRRHINDTDVFALRNSLKTKLNLEMGAAKDIVAVAYEVVPDSVCLVPEKRRELTTEGGLDVIGNRRHIEKAITRLKEKKIVISLFIDPIKEQIEAAKNVGADFVELHTGRYANAVEKRARAKELRQIIKASEYVIDMGLGLNAGHGLDYDNTADIAAIKGMYELNIGYSIICRAVFTGLETAVKEMKALISKAAGQSCC